MCPPTFLMTASRRRRHLLILLSIKRCESFCHSVTIARFSSSTILIELSLVVESLLKSTPNSVIYGINIRAIWRPHVRFNKIYVLFFRQSVVVRAMCVGAPSCCSVCTCNDDILLWFQAADPSRGRYCSSMSCKLFSPGSMKTALVFPIRDTPTDTVTEV